LNKLKKWIVSYIVLMFHYQRICWTI
jgi:hypothetical protein